MRKSINQNVAYRADQQLLSCSKMESIGLLAATLNGNELTTDFSSVNEQMKQQPRRTYR